MENLKIYLLDILSILLPGALLIAVLAQISSIKLMFLGIFPKSDMNWVNAVIYIGVAYTLGHFIFFIGSYLDEWIFKRVKRVFWNKRDQLAYIVEYKTEKTGIEDGDVINAFKWSCAYLLASHPEMYAVVERHIAESKFFRSLIVVLFISLLVFAFGGHFLPASIFFFMILLSLVRYLTQRQKSIETAYQFVITTSKKVFQAPNSKIMAGLEKEDLHPCNRQKKGKKKKKKNEKEEMERKEEKSIRCTIRKLFVVINLCLNPFYKPENL